MSEEKQKSVGAMWKNDYDGFSVSVELEDGSKLSLIAFPNKYKENDNHPDFKLFPKRAAKAGNDAPPPAKKNNASSKPKYAPSKPKTTPRPPAEDNLDEDVPF